MIALPSRAEAAIGAFADALVAERWDGFNVGDVATRASRRSCAGSPTAAC